MINISHPKNLISRNKLLQKVLRPEKAIIPIESEYPTVLTNTNSKYSYCLYHKEEIIAHANLWPRKLVDKGLTVTTVGLIGNVATKETWQGKGIMKSLLSYLTDKGQSLGMDTLILWSDLKQFYHKLGFQALGHEWRYLVRSPDKIAPHKFKIIDPLTLTDQDFLTLLNLRPSLRYNLSRSTEEFRTLLKIPYTYLFIYREHHKILGYAICGKGYDLNGVVHEWGFQRPADFPHACADICHELGINSCYVLVPESCHLHETSHLIPYCIEQKRHDMCLAKIIGDNNVKSKIIDSFIWGLDSI